MPTPVAPESPAAAIIAEERALWERVAAFFARSGARTNQSSSAHDAELIELRDAIAEAKPEDLAPLVEQMARVSAVAAGRRGKTAVPVDTQAPYFAHVRLRPTGPSARRGSERHRDILIGRRGFIDRSADIQIVDWRDAPVSQVYYRYDEGDDYDEQLGGSNLQGVIEVRRNVTIQDGRLRRIGCPQGTFFCDLNDVWWQADTVAIPALEGGQGLAARAPRPAPPRPQMPKQGPGPGQHPHRAPQAQQPAAALGGRVDKHLPEIAALIDRHQFSLITEPGSGVVVIQGGAGSGKTTVALHRVAYLAHNAPERFRGAKVLIIVPSEALARYVSGVLPALGVSSVPVLTCANWMRHHLKRLLPHLPQQVTAETPTTVARLKKHPRMLHALDEYVAAQAQEMRLQLASALSEHPAEQRSLLSAWDQTAKRPLRSRCRVVRGQVPTLLAGSPALTVRIDDLLRRLSRRAQDVARDWAELLTDSERLWRSLGEPGDSGALAVSRSDIATLVNYCKEQQEEVETLPDDVDPERYQAVDGQPLDDDTPAGQLDREDHALLLRLYQLKFGGLPHTSGKGFVRYEHVVLDEVQDLSALDVKTLLECVAQDGHPPSVTMAGDVVQRLIFDNGFTSWEDLLSVVGLPGTRVQRLHILYRSTVEVMQLAIDVLGPLASDDTEQQAVRHGAPVQAFVFGEMGEAVAFLGEALRSLLGREPTASVALIARHAGTADAYYRGLSRSDVPMLRRVERQDFTFAPGVDVTDVTQVKGLEFDYVVILDATTNAYPDGTESRHLLHIAMTRAAHQLWLVATATPSTLVPTHYFLDADSPGGAIMD